MAFDEKLAHRVRAALEGTQGAVERRMFGGLVFLVNGHLCCGVDRSELFVRLDRTVAERAAWRKYAKPFAPYGRRMGGMVTVAAPGLTGTRSLRSWLDPAIAFATSLPHKPVRAPRVSARPRTQRRKGRTT